MSLKLVILGWACASIFFTALLELSELGHKPLGFALYSNAVNIALWTLGLPLLMSFVRRFPWKRWRWLPSIALRLGFIALLAALVALLHWAIVYPSYFPYRAHYPTFRDVLRSELARFFQYEILIGFVLITLIEVWHVTRALQAERTRTLDLERRLAVARLETLRMQLNPHFLFNTLQNIAGLTVEAPRTARRMVTALGDLLRSTLRDTGAPTRPLAEELEYADLYLGIEKLRLGDRLALNYEIEPTAARALVPQFFLQPLIENAVRHGASQMAGPCEIRVSASCGPGTLAIVIVNDGPICEPSSAPRRLGVGIANTMDRLRIHYGDRHSFRFSYRPEGGARIEISIPHTD
jgi:two-component system, LytTR family, sensor kinase